MGALRELWDTAVVAINTATVEQVALGYTDDAVWVTPRETYTGREAILGRLRMDKTAFPDGQIRTVSSVEESETLMVEWEFVATHTGPWPMPDGSQLPPTGRQVTLPTVSVLSIVDGKVAQHRMYNDRLSVLVQLGLFPTA